MTWPFRLRPEPGELLSGYLCRIARAHGAQAHAFCALQFGNDQFWGRDPDRGAIPSLMRSVLAQCGLPAADVAGMTLTPWIERLVPRDLAATRMPACVPWINAVGIFHRTRTLHGLQFCPGCLADGPVVARAWRLACVAVCERHECLLHDACAACGAPFVPHRAARGVGWCHHCGEALHQAPQRRLATVPKEIIHFQRAALDELHAPGALASPEIGARRLPGLRILVSVAMISRAWPVAATLLDVEPGNSGPVWPVLEKSRLAERLPILTACARLAAAPEQARLLATRLGWTHKTFAAWRPLPPWLRAALGDLPEGVSRSRPARGTLASRIERLARERPPGWREERARLLMRAAGRAR